MSYAPKKQGYGGRKWLYVLEVGANGYLNAGWGGRWSLQRRPKYQWIGKMISMQIACTTDKVVAREISALWLEFLNDILQCAYENARSGVRSVTYNVVELVFSDLQRREEISRTLHGYISTYVDHGDAADIVRKRLFSTKPFAAPIAVFIQGRTGKAIAVERINTNMESQMNALIPYSAAKHTTSKSVSPPIRTSTANIPAELDKDEYWKSKIRHSKPHTH